MECARPGLQFYAEPTGANRFNNTPGAPKRGELYVICRDGSVQSVWRPESPVEWTLIEDDDKFYFSSPNGPVPCFVRYHATSEDPPVGRHATPQVAEIITKNDDGEIEVSSLLTQCAAIVNDPDQTEAISQFMHGKIGYAEMRARCG